MLRVSHILCGKSERENDDILTAIQGDLIRVISSQKNWIKIYFCKETVSTGMDSLFLGRIRTEEICFLKEQQTVWLEAHSIGLLCNLRCIFAK